MCAGVSFPSAARDWGRAGRDPGAASRSGESVEDDPESFRKYLRGVNQIMLLHWIGVQKDAVAGCAFAYRGNHLPPLSSVPGGGAQEAGGARAGPNL